MCRRFGHALQHMLTEPEEGHCSGIHRHQSTLMCLREPTHALHDLWHRFGHALQHMLTEVEEGHCSGIRGVEWDAVELPSQFMVSCIFTAY